MALTKMVDELTEADVPKFGGKACGLGPHRQRGLPIPNGFALATDGLRQLLEGSPDAAPLLRELQICEHAHDAIEIGARLALLIATAPLPNNVRKSVFDAFDSLGAERVAVRSSAPEEDGQKNSWAGQFESVLGVTRDRLDEALRRCWGSLFSARAVVYRLERGDRSKDPSMAIFIQEMIPATLSGVAFSRDPVSGHNMIIEAVLGLGEALVSGAIAPARYHIGHATHEVLEQQSPSQEKMLILSDIGLPEWAPVVPPQSAVLSPYLLLSLVEQVTAAEAQANQPIDMEWCVSDGELHIVQVRPLTGLRSELDDDVARYRYLAGKFRFSWGESHSIISAENYPRTYLTHRHLPGNRGRASYIAVESGYVSSYCFTEDDDRCLLDGAILCTPEGFRDYMRRSLETQDGWASLTASWRAERRTDTATLLRYYNSYQQLHDDTYALYRLSQPECGDALVQALRQSLQKKVPEERLHDTFITVTAPTLADIVQEEERAFLSLSLSEECSDYSLSEHAATFAWLFFNTYHRPTALQFLRHRLDELRLQPPDLRRMRIQTIIDLPHHAAKERDERLQELDSEEIAFLSGVLSELAVDRYRLKSCWAGAEWRFLDLFDAIADLAGFNAENGGTAAFLQSFRSSDITNLLAHGARLTPDNTTDRRAHYAVLYADGMLSWFEGAAACRLRAMLVPPEPDAERRSLIGTPAQVGLIRGRVRKIRVLGIEELMKDLGRFVPGEVLVTTMTQPTMVSLARRAAAIVTDEGGVTSHAAIIARELAIPCIVGTHRATEVLQDGDEVEVDAYAGRVTKIS